MNEFQEQSDRRFTDQSLEEQLALALARVEPSPDFAAGVLARVAGMGARREPWWKRVAGAVFAPGSLRWAPAFAAIVLVAAGTVYHEHQRVVEGLRAKQQLLEALRITNAKLQETGMRVAQVETRSKE